MKKEIVDKAVNALFALQGKSANDVISADTTGRRLCKIWLERELFPGGELDMETAQEYLAAFICAKSEAEIMELVGDRKPEKAARRLMQAIAAEETAGDRERAKKAKKDAVTAAKRYCFMHKHGKGAFTAYKNALNAAMPELDAQYEWQGEDEEAVNEYVLNLNNL